MLYENELNLYRAVFAADIPHPDTADQPRDRAFLTSPYDRHCLSDAFHSPIMAILLTTLAEGSKSVAGLLRKLFQWRIDLRWYVVALAMPVGIIFTADVLAFLLGWAPAIQFRVPERSMLIGNSIFIPPVVILEEFGWRGYALPRLLTYRASLSSALIIGIAWGILHISLGLSDGKP
jgi:membrane protease YdiL (CAAX protease family)